MSPPAARGRASPQLLVFFLSQTPIKMYLRDIPIPAHVTTDHGCGAIVEANMAFCVQGRPGRERVPAVCCIIEMAEGVSDHVCGSACTTAKCQKDCVRLQRGRKYRGDITSEEEGTPLYGAQSTFNRRSALSASGASSADRNHLVSSTQI